MSYPPKPASPELNTAHSMYAAAMADYPIVAGSGSTLTDLVAGRNITLSAAPHAPVWGTDTLGTNISFSGVSQYGDSGLTSPFSTLQNGDFGIRIFFSPTYLGVRNTLLSTFDGDKGILIDILATDKVRLACNFGGGGTIYRFADSTATLAYTGYVELWAIQRSGTIEIWMDGVNVSAATNTDGTIVNATSTATLKVAAPSGGFSNYGAFAMSSLEIFNRAPTSTPTTGEIAVMHADPWGLITPAAAAAASPRHQSSSYLYL